MKTGTMANLAKNIFIAVFTTMILFSLTSCVTKAKFESSSVVPGAQGFVKIKKDKNKNYTVQMKVQNLASSTMLTPAKRTYVIWLVSDQNETKNLGQFNTSSKLFSRKLNASFETVTSYKPTKLFITAEDEATVQYPGGELVLTTNSFTNR
jgi:hypothetical protein